MRIGIIGVGNVGVTLGRKLAAAGHEVAMGTRDPAGERAVAARAALGDGVPVDIAAAAARRAQVVVFAIPGTAMDETVAALAPDLGGKVVVDAANRIGVRLGDKDVMNSFAAFTEHAPTAAVFRAFNSLGWENLAEPVIGGVQADLLFCGPDGDGRDTVERVITDVGLRPVYVGGPETLPLVDALGALWGALAFGRGMGRRLVFKVITP
jgi:hypothetical protein